MHEDYHQYNQYCSNRIYRLRHAQPVRRELVHNSKYAEGVQLRRNAYCPRPRNPEANIPHENFLWVPLYQAERAWAQACEVQKQKRANKTQQLVFRKLRKAVKFAKDLQQMAAKACDERTQQEIESYVDWMNGNYALQKQDYRTALEAYRTSMNRLLQLAKDQNTDDPKSLVLADLWTKRAESVLRPLVRFCQYECKDATPYMAEEATDQSSKAAESTIKIRFRGNDIPLDPYKELCVLHLKAEGLGQQQQPLDESSFLTLLSTFDDAIAYIEDQFAKYESIQSGPAVNAKKSELETLMAYWKYQKLYVCLHKNQDRLKDCQSDAEIVHVYDALLQNAQQLAQVGGSGSEQEEAEAHVLRIRAMRCFVMSKVYLGQLHQIREAKALWKQAQTLTKHAIEELAACDTRDKQHEQEMENYLEALENLQKKELPALEVRLKAARYLQEADSTGGFTSGTNRPLWMRLEEFDPGMPGSMVDDPPRPIPIPCKPVFYDIAWKYAGGNFPVDQLQEEIEKREPKASGSGGIFGWLTGSK